MKDKRNVILYHNSTIFIIYQLLSTLAPYSEFFFVQKIQLFKVTYIFKTFSIFLHFVMISQGNHGNYLELSTILDMTFYLYYWRLPHTI